MAATVPSRIGQINGAGDELAIFLKVYGGEVLTAFSMNQITMDKHVVRTISSGKSAQFPASGKKAASYHTPGAEILGSTMNHAERIISIDDLLLASSFIANIDEAMNHYDVRSIYTTEDGEALAQVFDKNVLQVGALAARSAATVTGGSGGAQLTAATFKTDSAVLAAGFFDAAQTLDEKWVPEMDRYGYLLPAQYYLLAQNTNVINKDWDGSGSYANGKVKMIAGITMLKTNNLPSTVIAADAGENNVYAGTFTNTAALVMNKRAVGTVKLLDLKVESQYMVNRQGTLMVSKYALGHGILRPECAVELSTT